MNKFKSAFIYFLLLLTGSVSAQPLNPADYGLTSFSIKDKQLGLIRFYIDTTNLKRKAPIFIDVNGCGGLPLCLYIKGTDYATICNTFNPQIVETIKERFHYVILDKPGTPFCDSITANQKIRGADLLTLTEHYKPSKEYNTRLSLQWRVDATKKVIDWLIKNNYWDKTKIIAYGYSEGAQVVPSLAVADKRITHIIPVVGGGLNQFYDDLLDWRIRAAKGEITQQQAQDSIDNYLKIVKDIYEHHGATDMQYEGHSYQRWASFCSTVALEQLRKLTIPIYMIVGTNDTNSPIYGLDYIQLDFLRLGKTNLTYDPCVGCTHQLVSKDNNNTTEHFNDYLQKILKWIDAQ